MVPGHRLGAPSARPGRLSLTASLCLLNLAAMPARAEPPLACGHFTREPVAAPAPRSHPLPVRRAERIAAAVRTQPYRALFLGDSLTERWQEEAQNAPVWQEHMAR